MSEALTLLTSAMQLLAIISANPNLPLSFREAAITIGNTAITVAQRELGSAPSSVGIFTPASQPQTTTSVATPTIADAKQIKTDELKKEYGLKINALEKELLELDFFQGKEGKILRVHQLRYYATADIVAELGFPPTQTQFKAAERINAVYEATNPTARYIGTVTEELGKIKSEIRNQIATLRNELERKLLEI